MTSSRILIVEDERIVAMHLQQKLERLGYEVPALAASGRQALECINEFAPDLVLMDIYIEGDMDGIETATKIPEELLIPVVYLTAYSEDSTLARARATKPYGYLLKPFAERELHATLQMVLERRSTELALRESEKRLRQAQKMEVVGQLTGGIAHDFNNLLAVVVGNLELVEEQLEDNLDLQEMIRDALAAAHRGADLTRKLLAYSRQQPLNPQIIDLNPLVSGMISLVRRSLGETIEIETHLEAGWTARCDQNLLENALLNLAINARDAMPDGGKLTIETSDAVLDQNYTDLHIEATPGEYVLVAVTDNGVGIPLGLREKILEPFFTTKGPGQGSGLGLSMVHGFVKQSGGHMAIYSEIGIGTKMALYLPKAAGEPGASPFSVADADALPCGRGQTILVVEDDAMVRKIAARTLTELGYRVLEAGDALAANRVLGQGGKIDLLFTDVVLPNGVGGVELASLACAGNPELKLLFTSGYTSNAVFRNGLLDAESLVLVKPYTKAALARKLHEIFAD